MIGTLIISWIGLPILCELIINNDWFDQALVDNFSLIIPVIFILAAVAMTCLGQHE